MIFLGLVTQLLRTPSMIFGQICTICINFVIDTFIILYAIHTSAMCYIYISIF